MPSLGPLHDVTCVTSLTLKYPDHEDAILPIPEQKLR